MSAGVAGFLVAALVAVALVSYVVGVALIEAKPVPEVVALAGR